MAHDNYIAMRFPAADERDAEFTRRRHNGQRGLVRYSNPELFWNKVKGRGEWRSVYIVAWPGD